MKILITGPTGQVAFPLARVLARTHEVWGLARFRDPRDRERLEAVGVCCAAGDLAEGRFDGLPRDFDQVLNFAVAKSGNFDRDLAANAEGLGLLMMHCRSARALLHCSSTAVYQPAGHRPLAEDHPLGDNHRVFLPTYSLSKIAAESMARFVARGLGIPTTIARLNVPYGDGGGWPAIHLEQILAGSPIAVSPEAPNLYNPIHEDDIAAMLPRLLEIASVPATVVNWAGSAQASIEEWCGYLGSLVGREPRFAVTDRTITSVAVDVTRMHQRVGETKVPWRDGMRRMVRARHPEIALAQ
jgi:nucleoside-diphosphate-sugar epimerase